MERWLLAAALLASSAGCRKGGDEQAILELIDEAARLAEAHETSEIMDLATDDFVAEPGGRDSEEVRGILQFAFMRYGEMRIVYPKPSIEITPPDMARAGVPFVIMRAGGPVPDLGGLVEDHEKWLEEASRSADPYHLDLWLLKTSGRWKVAKVHIEGLRPVEEI